MRLARIIVNGIEISRICDDQEMAVRWVEEMLRPERGDTFVSIEDAPERKTRANEKNYRSNKQLLDAFGAKIATLTPVEKHEFRKGCGFSNQTIDNMLANNVALTVENYVSLKWGGEKTILDLEGEDLAEVQHLSNIELLKSVTPWKRLGELMATRWKRIAKKGAILLLLTIFFWGSPASAQGYGQDTEGKPRLVLIKPLAPPRKDIPAIAKAANGAIVTIVMANNDKPIARGTGFLVSPDGFIMTNYHVIANGNEGIVKFPDGTVLAIDGVLAANKTRDLAVIKIYGKTFRTLTLGDSDRIQIGEGVVAIGNPLGLELTVSNGILSGVRTEEKLGGKFLQTTAPISHGSSGGPLFNMFGEVVGINSMYLEGGENLNFAIPVNDAKLLLSNQSAELQNLPNEALAPAPSTSETRHASLAEQKICSEQVRLLSESKESLIAKSVYQAMYASHFDAQSGACYEIITHPHTTTTCAGAGRCVWVYTHSITDAFEDRLVGLYSETHLQSEKGEDERVGGAFCIIDPPNQSEITCKSEKDFNQLALQYFGITP